MHLFRQIAGTAPKTKKLILHIGTSKTGSSAIQRFLSKNHLALREEGIVVPNKDFQVVRNIGGHHVFSFVELLNDPPEGRKRLEDALDEVEMACPARPLQYC